ncbi:MAG: hypothetical protein NVS9B1_02030 [Candidatus Dormibacteraceae bacterium]
MPKQLRIYTVKPGEMEDWCREWKAKIVPLRARHDFRIEGPWVIDAHDQFVWMMEYTGEDGWDVADARYYDSQERKDIAPEPMRHLVKREQWFIREA